MTNPDISASQLTFEEKVSLAVDTVKRNDKGKLEFSEDTPEEVVLAATTEVRRRDTQRAYTKSQQEKMALEAEKNELLKQLSEKVEVELSPEQVEELEELKFSDPEKWRSKLNTYETQAKSHLNTQIEERLKDVSAKGIEAAELERRKEVLEEFQARNKGFEINDEILANDIPPRITNKLKNNTVSFEEFLQEVYDYLNTGKVVATTEKTLNQPNLSKAGGGDTPSNEAVRQQSNKSYETEIY